ncbi:unnamed protein product [Closterium sp. Yama58-4]|nr:unnamed protein product [Closterium sp. Yama58-4]
MAAWGGAFRATRAAWKKRKGPMLMPGLLEAQQLAVARQPERVLRNRGLVEIGQVCLPNALQQSIKAIVAEESIRLLGLPPPNAFEIQPGPPFPPPLSPHRFRRSTPGATSSAHVHRDVRRLMAAYDAFFSGWPQPSAERLADDTREPPLMREMDVGRIPDARMARLLRGWEKNSWGKSAEEGGDGDARETAERGKGGARERGERGRRAVEYGETEALAYAAARMPSSYASVFRALTEVKRRLPSLAPSSLLDFGSGPGTVMWAASEVWGSTVQRAAAVEPADAMWAMGERIRAVAAAGPRAPRALPPVERYTTLQHLSREARGADRVFDVVVAGPPSLAQANHAFHTQLILLCISVLLLSVLLRPLLHSAALSPPPLPCLASPRPAHPMPPRPSHMSQKAARLADRGPSKNAPHPSKPILPPGAHVLAPCPHDGHCPMYGTVSWCHFSQTLQRSAVQRIAKVRGTHPSTWPCYSALPLSLALHSLSILASWAFPLYHTFFALPRLTTPLAPSPATEGSGAGDNGQHGGGEVLICGAAQGTSTRGGGTAAANSPVPEGGEGEAGKGGSREGGQAPGQEARPIPQHTSTMATLTCLLLAVPVPSFTPLSPTPLRCAPVLCSPPAKWGPTVRLIPLDEGPVDAEGGALQGDGQGEMDAGDEGERVEEDEEEEEEEEEDVDEEEEADVRPKHTPVSSPDEESGEMEGSRDGETDMDGNVTDSSGEGDNGNDDDDLDDDTIDPELATDNPPRGDRFANLSPEWSRVIRKPRRRGQHVIVDVCASVDGRGRRGELQRLLFSKAAGRVEYRFARKVRWGDLWPSMGEAQEGEKDGKSEGADTSMST